MIRNILKKYTNGLYREIVEASDYIMKFSSEQDAFNYYKKQNYIIDEKYLKEYFENAKKIMDLIRKCNKKTVYRIEENNPAKSEYFCEVEEKWVDKSITNNKVGDVIKLGIRSTTNDYNWINKVLESKDEGVSLSVGEYRDAEYSEYEKHQSQPIIYEIENANALDVSKYSEFNQKECLIYGSFEILEMEAPFWPNEINGIQKLWYKEYKDFDFDEFLYNFRKTNAIKVKLRGV